MSRDLDALIQLADEYGMVLHYESPDNVNYHASIKAPGGIRTYEVTTPYRALTFMALLKIVEIEVNAKNIEPAKKCLDDVEVNAYGRYEGTVTRATRGTEDGPNWFRLTCFVGNVIEFECSHDVFQQAAGALAKRVAVIGSVTHPSHRELPIRGRAESVTVVDVEPFDVGKLRGSWAHLDWQGRSSEELINEVRNA